MDSRRLRLVSHSLALALLCSDDFDYNYRGGIYVDHTNATESNHDVEVVGWGFDPELQMKYWIARNSWGVSKHTHMQRQRGGGGQALI